MKSLKIITKDRSGLVAEISALLANHNINILELEGQSFDQQAVIELVVDHQADAINLLNSHGFKTISTDLITLRIKDQPGALAKVTRELNDTHISIRGISTLQRQDGYCFVALSTDNDEVARTLLQETLI
ncbi:MAG: ACT domain-containing protein [Pseudomonadota bacterium]